MLVDDNTESYLDLGGTIRAESITSTLHRLKPILKKIGITRVANITGLDNLNVPVAISIRPNSKHLAVSQGKGLTWELAMASAMMESLESYHVENAQSHTLYGAYAELRQHYPVLNPALFVSGTFISPTLDEFPMGWVEAKDLNHSHQIFFIPHALTCLDTTLRHPEYAFLSSTTNGLAAGNTLEEAICHALYEIIERDALFRWSGLPEDTIAKTQVKLESIHSPINKEVIEKFKKAEQLIKVWEITSAVNIPSFHCVIKDANPLRGLGMFRGTGTHLSKEIALSRALTEAAQSRLTVISGARDDVFTDQYIHRTSFNYSYKEYAGTREYKDCYQPRIENSFHQNIRNICENLSRQGFEQVLLVDHTKPELGIPVAQLFIPGMQYNGARI